MGTLLLFALLLGGVGFLVWAESDYSKARFDKRPTVLEDVWTDVKEILSGLRSSYPVCSTCQVEFMTEQDVQLHRELVHE